MWELHTVQVIHENVGFKFRSEGKSERREACILGFLGMRVAGVKVPRSQCTGHLQGVSRRPMFLGRESEVDQN